MIKRLFRLSETTPIDGFVLKGEDAWFKTWVNTCIAEIQVVTNKGIFSMEDLTKMKRLSSILPQKKLQLRY